MTRVDVRRDDRDPQRSKVPGRNPYLILFRTPGALAFSASAFVGRMSMSMYGLGTVLLISSLSGKYGAAGTVAGAGSIGYALLSPYIAQLADRFGQSRVLLIQVGMFALASAIFITSAELRAPFPVLFAAGAVAGGLMPSMSSMVRTRWSSLLAGDARRLQSAFALESVNDEIIFVIGPALVTLLATQVFAASGVGTASLLAITGTVVFALRRSTEPTPRPKPEPTTGPTATGQPEDRPGRARWRSRLPSLPATGLITLSPAFLALGAMFVSIDLSSVAFATEHGHRPLAGLILGTYALGSAIGGLWYGSRHWRAPLGRRFLTTATITVCGTATFMLMPGLFALDAACLVAGLSIAPTLIASYEILERQAPPHRRTQAMAWLGSTISVGLAFGSAVVGHILDAHGARLGYAFASSCGAVAVLICVAGRRSLVTEDGTRSNREQGDNLA